MIEFAGNLSEKNKKILGKSQLKNSCIAGWITAVLFAIIITVLTIKCSPLFALGYLVCVLGGVASSVPIKHKYRELICPNNIVIDDDIITCYGKDFSQERNIKDIKQIDDYDDYYRIWFNFPNQSQVFLCQKDLLIEGSIEEFEERFASLIVRKAKTLIQN